MMCKRCGRAIESSVKKVLLCNHCWCLRMERLFSFDRYLKQLGTSDFSECMCRDSDGNPDFDAEYGDILEEMLHLGLKRPKGLNRVSYTNNVGAT